MKHFEQLWEESEKIAYSNYNNFTIDEIIQECLEQLKLIKVSKTEHDFGQLLLKITYLSYIFNINAYSALEAAILDEKIAQLDEPDED